MREAGFAEVYLIVNHSRYDVFPRGIDNFDVPGNRIQFAFYDFLDTIVVNQEIPFEGSPLVYDGSALK